MIHSRYDNQSVLINDLIWASTTWQAPTTWPVPTMWHQLKPGKKVLSDIFRSNPEETELSFHSICLNWDDLIGSRPNIFNSELSNPITNLPESRFSSFLWSSIIQKSIKTCDRSSTGDLSEIKPAYDPYGMNKRWKNYLIWKMILILFAKFLGSPIIKSETQRYARSYLFHELSCVAFNINSVNLDFYRPWTSVMGRPKN